MTDREKIAHLYRRFGFGATPDQLDQAQKRGVDWTIRHLIDFEDAPENFNVSPWEFVWREKEEPDLGAYRFRLWWAFRMLSTHRPLEERMTLFWHNHFAVSDSKVEDGPMMVQYLDTLRTNALGDFEPLLGAVSKDPAMMRYLDMQRSIRGRPNENFAREVMELFTLGIGNYTEKDVQEAARAFTGWGYLHIFWELPGTTESKVRDAIAFGRPFSGFAPIESMHDPTEKTFLGKTESLNGDGVLARLAHHPVTARRLVKKIWEHFAYEDPSPTTLDKIQKSFTEANGNIRRTLHAIAKSPEFWSAKCVRNRIKSPVDLCIPIARQLGVGEALLAQRDPKADATTRIPQMVLDHMWGLCDRMEKAGLSLFYPPDVSGWRWGKAWISPAAMVERYRWHGMMVYGDAKTNWGSRNSIAYVKSRQPKDSVAIADALSDFFDLGLSKDSRKVIATMLDKRGGVKTLDHLDWWSGALDNSLFLAMAAPETHFD